MSYAKTILRYFSIAFLIVTSRQSRADPVKLQPVAVTASNSWNGFTPNLATDGNSSTYWNSGGYPSQWIQLDLGRPMPVSKIRIQFAPNPAGQQSGTISLGPDTGHLVAEYSWNQPVSDQDWIEFSGDAGSYHGGNVRYIRITTTQSASWVALREIEVYGGIEYFGYFRDSAFNVGPKACNNARSCDFATQTIAAGANLVWIGATSTADLASRLAEVQQHPGVKAVVDLWYFAWNNTQLYLSGWNDVKNTIDNGNYQRTIAAFYLYDEPERNGIAPSDLAWLASQVKADYPSIPTAVIYNPTVIMQSTDSTWFWFLDWVGFDAYDTWSGGYGYGMKNIISKLRSFLSGSQRMIAVPAAMVSPQITAFPDTSPQVQQDEIENNNNNWQIEILSDSKYVAIVPYIWQDMDDTTTGTRTTTGTQDIPYFQDREYEMAYSFLPLPAGDTHSYATSTPASASWSNTYWFPFAAFDRDPNTYWNAGAYAPQWIEQDLSGTTLINKVQLTTLQDQAGTTTHTLYGFTPSTGTWQALHTWSGPTGDGTVLVWPSQGDLLSPPLDVNAIYVETTQSPSWVAWRNIEVFRVPPLSN